MAFVTNLEEQLLLAASLLLVMASSIIIVLVLVGLDDTAPPTPHTKTLALSPEYCNQVFHQIEPI